MVTVVNRSQQVVAAGLQPRSAYSRVMALHADVADGVGNETYEYTDTFGQVLRLLRFDVWLFNTDLTSVIDGWFTVMTGQEVLYRTVPRRFGIVLHNLSATVPFSVIVTFTVSEG